MRSVPIGSWMPALPLLLAVACGGASYVQGPLQITLIPPATAMPSPGAMVTLQVKAQGQGPYRYQWLKNNLVLAGATSNTLTLGPVGFGDAGAYRVQVSNGATTLLTDPYDVEPADSPWLVTSTVDDAPPAPPTPGSLRAVLAQANSNPGVNGIQFALPGPGPYQITLQADLPAITGSVCILGPFGSPLTVDGGGLHRPFIVNGGTLVLDQFTVANGLGKGGDGLAGGGGAAGMGGGLFINKGGVTLLRMTFQGNTAQGGNSGFGLDGQAGGGGGFGGDSPGTGGAGAGGGVLGGTGGAGDLDGAEGEGGPAVDGDGAGGGTAGIGDQLGGDGTWGGGGGFAVDRDSGGGQGSPFGGGGGGSGGDLATGFLPGGASGVAGFFGGEGGKGDGISVAGRGGGGAGLGGAVFLRAGSLAMSQCQFVDNHAVPGQGANPGQGKGGALFIYEYNLATKATYSLQTLQAQTYSGNTATDLVESPTYDNANYYVAQTFITAGRIAPAMGLLYELYRQNQRLGLPWVRPAP